ncbi:hypothetical protein V8E36_002799, partial [Tilletia maclaganii]
SGPNTTPLGTPQRPAGCIYCFELGHQKRECPHLLEHLQKQYVKLQDGNRVFWMDGTPVRAIFGAYNRTVQERLQQGTLPTAA